MAADWTPHDQSDRLRIFISYSRDDVAIADQLHATLIIGGYEPLIDREGIDVAENWQQRLQTLIRGADVFLVLLSPSWARSGACLAEVDWALADHKRIVPVLCRPLGEDRPPAAVAALNYIYLYSDPRKSGTSFGAGLLELKSALESDLDWLREHTRLLERAAEWHSAGRSAIRLLSGTDIEDAQAWVSRQPKNAPPPTALHLAFIQASEAEEGRRQSVERLRLEQMAAAQAEREAALAAKALAQQREALQARRVVRITAAGLVVALGLAGTASWLGYTAEQERIKAEQALSQVRANARAWVETLVARTATLPGAAAPVPAPGQAAAPDLAALQAQALRAETALAAGQLAQARSEAEQGLAGWMAAGAAPNAQPERGLVGLRLYRTLGIAAARQGRPSHRLATLSLDQALQLAEQLAAQSPAQAVVREALAQALQDAGELAVDAGPHPAAAGARAPDATDDDGYGAAQQHFDRLLGLRRADLAAAQAPAAARVRLAAAYNRLAHLALVRDDAETADAHITAALAQLQAAPTAPAAGDSDTALQRELTIAYHFKGIVLQAQDRNAEALGWFERDVALSRTMAQAQPEVAERWHGLSTALSRLSDLLNASGQAGRALEVLDESVRSLDTAIEKGGGARPDWLRDAAALQDERARLLTAAQRPSDATAALRRGLALRAQEVALAGGAGSAEELQETWRLTRRTLARLGRTEEAMVAAEQQLFAAALVPCFEPTDPNCDTPTRSGNVAQALSEFAWTSLLVGDGERAAWAAQRATALHPELFDAHLNLAHAELLAGRGPRAMQLYRNGLVGAPDAVERWKKGVLKDFESLRGFGVAHPMMGEVERLMKP